MFAVSDICVSETATLSLVTVGRILSLASAQEPIQLCLSSAARSSAGPAVPTLSEMSPNKKGRERTKPLKMTIKMGEGEKTRTSVSETSSHWGVVGFLFCNVTVNVTLIVGPGCFVWSPCSVVTEGWRDFGESSCCPTTLALSQAP